MGRAIAIRVGGIGLSLDYLSVCQLTVRTPCRTLERFDSSVQHGVFCSVPRRPHGYDADMFYQPRVVEFLPWPAGGRKRPKEKPISPDVRCHGDGDAIQGTGRVCSPCGGDWRLPAADKTLELAPSHADSPRNSVANFNGGAMVPGRPVAQSGIPALFSLGGKRAPFYLGTIQPERALVLLHRGIGGWLVPMDGSSADDDRRFMAAPTKGRTALAGFVDRSSAAVFLLSSSKLPHYILPIYPPLAIILAAVIDKALTDTTVKKSRIFGFR